MKSIGMFIVYFTEIFYVESLNHWKYVINVSVSLFTCPSQVCNRYVLPLYILVRQLFPFQVICHFLVYCNLYPCTELLYTFYFIKR